MQMQSTDIQIHNSLLNCQNPVYMWEKKSLQVFQRASQVAPARQETQVPSLGWEDPPGEGNGNPLQYSCLGNCTQDLAIYSTWGHKVSDKTQQLNISSRYLRNTVFKDHDIKKNTAIYFIYI